MNQPVWERAPIGGDKILLSNDEDGNVTITVPGLDEDIVQVKLTKKEAVAMSGGMLAMADWNMFNRMSSLQNLVTRITETISNIEANHEAKPPQQKWAEEGADGVIKFVIPDEPEA